MPCKLTLFFRQNNSGWTEVWYTQNNDPISASNLTLAQINHICALRNRSTVFDAIRASVEPSPPVIGSPRLSWLRVIGQGGVSGITEGPDLVNADALVRAKTSSVKYRHLWMRGLNDEDTIRNFDGTSSPSPFFVANFGVFANDFPNIAWCMKVLDPVTVNPLFPVVSFGTAPVFGNLTVVNLLAATVPPNVGDRVVFKGVDQTQMPGLRGVFTVVSSVAGATPTFVIGYRFRNTSNPYFPPFAQWRKVTYTYPQIQQLDFLRFSDHDTGRPISPSRGRRPAKRLRF